MSPSRAFAYCILVVNIDMQNNNKIKKDQKKKKVKSSKVKICNDG